MHILTTVSALNGCVLQVSKISLVDLAGSERGCEWLCVAGE